MFSPSGTSRHLPHRGRLWGALYDENACVHRSGGYPKGTRSAALHRAGRPPLRFFVAPVACTARRGEGTPPYGGDNETVCRGRRPRRPVGFIWYYRSPAGRRGSRSLRTDGAAFLAGFGVCFCERRAYTLRRLTRRNTVDISRMPTAREAAMPIVSRPLPTASIMLPSRPRLMV